MNNKLRHLFLWFSKKTLPVDVFSKRFPISIKGVIIYQNKVLLLKNEREEWDLPGGKVRNDNSAINCLIREVKEETNLEVKSEKILGTVIYNVLNWIKVFVIFYKCTLISSVEDFKISGEHFEGKFFSYDEIPDLVIYEGYRKIIMETLEAHIK